MKTEKVKPDAVKSYVCSILEGYGVPSEKARITSDVLVEADMRGIFSHGINQLDIMILPSLVAGGIDPDAVAEDKTRNPNFPIRHIDAHGSMIPLGGLGKGEAEAGYKGTGLAILIELDSVIGGGVSEFVSSLVFDERRWIRQAFEAWRIDTLFPSDQSLQHISDTVWSIHKGQGPRMLLPGEKEAKNRKVAIREGIPYTKEQIVRLEKMGRALGLGNVS